MHSPLRRAGSIQLAIAVTPIPPVILVVVVRVARTLHGSAAYIEAHSADDCSNQTLCSRAQLSSFHFLRLFHSLAGQTPRQFVINTRLRRAAMALRATREPITRIAMDVGFGDLSHFVGSFTRVFGASPRNYRKRS